MTFLISWLISAVAIVLTAYLLPGVRLSGFFAALVTSLVLGLINTFIKPLLLLLTLPLNMPVRLGWMSKRIKKSCYKMEHGVRSSR